MQNNRFQVFPESDPEDGCGGGAQEVGVVAGRHILVEGVARVVPHLVAAILRPQLLNGFMNVDFEIPASIANPSAASAQN